MTELQIELPVKLNGIIITKNVRFVLDEIQANCTLGFDKPVYNNEGIKTFNEYAAEINNYLIEIIADAAIGEDISKENQLLVNLHWILNKLNYLSLSEDLINELNKTM